MVNITQASAQMPIKSRTVAITPLTVHSLQQTIPPHSQPSLRLNLQGVQPVYLKQQLPQ